MSSKKNKKNKQGIIRIISNNWLMLRTVATLVPEYIILTVIDGFVWGAIGSATTIFNYHLLNSLSDGSGFSYAFKIIAIMAVFNTLVYAFDKWYWCIQYHVIRHKLHYKIHSKLFEKAKQMDLSCFDDPEFYNDFVWAMSQASPQANNVIENTGVLIKRIVAFVTLSGLLVTVDPLIAAIIILSSITNIVCNTIGNKLSYKHGRETNEKWRKTSYINRVYRLSDYAKEIRVNHADELLMKDYDETTKEIVDIDVKYGKKYFLLYGLGWNSLSYITFFGIMLYMVSKIGVSLTVGGFVASTNVVMTIRWNITDVIERLTNYTKYSLFIEKYRDFMDAKPTVVGNIKDIPDFESLEIRNVSFSYVFDNHARFKYHDEDYIPPRPEYPEKCVLKKVNMKINRGEKIAIVGYNGAGKTSLIKLIMRYYDPTEGEILYNGINIKEFDPVSYREKIGAVFQDFKIFAASIADNVMCGEFEKGDEERVIKALEAADFGEKLISLPLGIDTVLSREFDENGTNLSGGESQKVAISRVFARGYPIVIMDEPSSALDPMAEYNLNRAIVKNTSEKTVIFISHRLSTTRIADTVYMFDSGKLVECGSHDELISIDGKYAEMFRLQAEKYKEG